MPSITTPTQQQNPAHALIARSSTSLSPTETLTTPATASGIFPRTATSSLRTGSPPRVTHEVSLGSSGEEGVDSNEGEEGQFTPIEIDETFSGSPGLRWPGNIKIIVQATTFWAHRDILVFASPFFDAALSGSWSETKARPVSTSSIITIQQTPSVHGQQLATAFEESEPSVTITAGPDEQTTNDLAETSENESSFFSVRISPSSDSENEHSDEAQGRVRSSSSSREGGDEDEGETEEAKTLSAVEEAEKDAARISSLDKLQGRIPPAIPHPSRLPGSKSPKKKAYRRSRVPEGVIILKEERATIFHDFLKFIYPHLECTITWKNVEGLMNISDKLCVPSLQNACLQFLLSHAAGKPIKAMRIAEIFGQEELYREASRFVLEDLYGWSEEELNTLSKDTLLKLEKRRNWFLERVLKLGTVSIAKEYQCCATCPDPSICARQLEERWKAGYMALFRFGPAQPSMVFRYLRSLEGGSPPLALTHLSCQMHAKTWVENLFDRMFSLGVRGAEPPALTTRVGSVTPSQGLRRNFLYCTLMPEPSASRNISKHATNSARDRQTRGSSLY
ncbi:SubName: Full=Uncharacterized protein {ECO:0000313/EMBL:CCA75670.1} [Serendipita indica DSM 11827]|uniref:BTB domain-containing protein n=1 Tax=Serendipita indica (strain DSM 11827) TaxID=1109443 RepID=G4TWH7_SERID|nr:SubName: Full=Uncharacterized protein {ECO:0000313/EMBL:CCA75670.1} [Serendipita indica DSM 11827]CCA75670.1 hypothetical protein PIIN_09660 [Serendipita indica DSM 11827]